MYVFHIVQDLRLFFITRFDLSHDDPLQHLFHCCLELSHLSFEINSILSILHLFATIDHQLCEVRQTLATYMVRR